MEMPPAWRVTYRIELAALSNDLLTEVKWRGEKQGNRFEFRECADDAVGDVSVLSAQPYKDDAIRECDRLIRDVCSMLAVDLGRQFVAHQPPMDVKPTAGAKGDSHGEGVRVTVSGSARLEIHLASGKDLTGMAAAVARTPELRADCDTFALAMGERDEPTRLVTLYRLYDRLAARAMEHEPQLLTDGEIDAIVQRAVDELVGPSASDPVIQTRVEQTLRSALARLRARSRADVLAAHLATSASPLDPKIVRKIDGERGKFAHTSSQATTAVDAEVLTTVQQIVASQITALLDADP